VSSPPSVLEKAQAMTAEASRLQQGADAEHDAIRVSQRVEEITQVLVQLRQVVQAVDRLRAVSNSECVDLSGLDDGRAAFARHAASGLPSNQVFTAAKRKINGVISRVSAELGIAWSQWTAERMAGLPLVRIALLEDEEERASARSLRDDLRQLARVPVPTRADVNSFHSAAGTLMETLGQVSDQSEDLLALLQRLGERPPLTLDQVTDDQIMLLRQADIADQIEVRRRGT
jgi:hypothetical protein